MARNLNKRKKVANYKQLVWRWCLQTDVPYRLQYWYTASTQAEAEDWAVMVMTALKEQGCKPFVAQLFIMIDKYTMGRRVRVLYNKSAQPKALARRLAEVHQGDI